MTEELKVSIYIKTKYKSVKMENDFTKLQALFVALQKPRRECLFDLSNKDYKNTVKKQIIWSEIAEEMGMSRNDVQSLWKRTKIKYRAALNKENPPSGSARRVLRPLQLFLTKEMAFIRPFLEDDESRSCNATAQSTSFQELFDEVASEIEEGDSSSCAAPTPRKKPKNNIETSLLKSLDKIGEMQNDYQKQQQERDPFYDYLQSIIEKLPPEKGENLKKEIIKMALEQ